MAHRISHQLSVRLAALAGVLATLCVLLTLSAPSASAATYCWGHGLSKFGRCWGAERNLSEVRGYGTEKSVCLGAGALWGGCSGGPNQIKTVNFGTVYKLQPWIEDNAEGFTWVYAEVF
jgi:hypothetical protein